MGNYYFIAKAVLRKEPSRLALSQCANEYIKDPKGYLAHFPYFIDEETQENQRGQMTCPRSTS